MNLGACCALLQEMSLERLLPYGRMLTKRKCQKSTTFHKI